MHELRFSAGVHRVAEDRTATFYVMNTGVNRNRWAVSDQALEQALLTLVGKSLCCGPGYVIDRHYGEPVKVGEFIDVRKPDGYALGASRVDDDTVWERLITGEWGPVSVVITSYLERCSRCGDVLSGLDDPFSHQCILDGAHLVVESFTFDRVDFVDAPAYPQAGLIKSSDSVVPIELLAAYSLQSNEDRAAGPGGVAPNQLGDEKMEEFEERCTALEGDLESLREQVSRLEAELMESGAPKSRHEEVDGLKAAMEDARERLFGRRLE